MFASVLLVRLIEDAAPGIVGTETHWFAGLLALVWLAAGAAQFWRSRAGGRLGRLRFVLACLYGAFGLLILALGATLLNPALDGAADNIVLGAPVLSTSFPPTCCRPRSPCFVAWRFAFLSRRLRLAQAILAAALAALWAFLAIRHAWRGDAMSDPGFTEPEALQLHHRHAGDRRGAAVAGHRPGARRACARSPWR